MTVLPRGGAQMSLQFWQTEAVLQSGTAARVSVWCLAQQALMDAYLCLLHLTTGAPQLDCCCIWLWRTCL